MSQRRRLVAILAADVAGYSRLMGADEEGARSNASKRCAANCEQRLYLLNAWHESPLYTERERAALGWTEAVTRVADTHAPDAAYDDVRRHFEDRELVDLTTLIGLINLWNRLAIGFRYQHPVEQARGD